MQMIAHYSVADYARFRQAFDADGEDRGMNGLSLLQLWRESDTSVWALFEVGNAAKARDWLAGAAAVFHSQAGVGATAFHFVETA